MNGRPFDRLRANGKVGIVKIIERPCFAGMTGKDVPAKLTSVQ